MRNNTIKTGYLESRAGRLATQCGLKVDFSLQASPTLIWRMGVRGAKERKSRRWKGKEERAWRVNLAGKDREGRRSCC